MDVVERLLKAPSLNPQQNVFPLTPSPPIMPTAFDVTWALLKNSSAERYASSEELAPLRFHSAPLPLDEPGPRLPEQESPEEDDPLEIHEGEEEARRRLEAGIPHPVETHGRPSLPTGVAGNLSGGRYRPLQGNPFAKAWATLKALPEQQMYTPTFVPPRNLAGEFHPGPATGRGTVHPAIAGLLARGAMDQYELEQLQMQRTKL